MAARILVIQVSGGKWTEWKPVGLSIAGAEIINPEPPVWRKS